MDLAKLPISTLLAVVTIVHRHWTEFVSQVHLPSVRACLEFYTSGAA